MNDLRITWRLASGALLLSGACSEVAGVDERPCEPGCVDDATLLVCENDGPRAEPCPSSENECMAPVCQAGACTLEPAMGEACGPSGEATCNEAAVCLGPDLRLSAILTHTCVVADDGRVYCWGDNASGELGDGTQIGRYSPVAVKNLPEPAADVSAGYAHTCALMRSGAVYCWGNNEGAQIGTGSTSRDPILESFLVDLPLRVVDIAAGNGHTCALTEEETVYCWGNTFHGQCGVDPSTVATFVVGPVQVRGLDHVSSIETVKNHSCAVRTAAPTLMCWGSNTYLEPIPPFTPVHKLGPGAADLEFSWTPVAVDLPGNVLDVGMSYESTWALTDQDQVWGWGYNKWQQLGVGLEDEVVAVPATVKTEDGADLRNVSNVARTDGSDQCVELHDAVESGTRHLCWGRNHDGELGFGTEEALAQDEFHYATPTILPKEAREFVRGESHGCFAISTDTGEEIRCYGRATLIGDGTEPDPASPPPSQLVPKAVLWLPELTLTAEPNE